MLSCRGCTKAPCYFRIDLETPTVSSGRWATRVGEFVRPWIVTVLGVTVLAAGSVMCASAAPLIYTPVNPSFGGNPLNSSHLLGTASAQRTATAGNPDTGGLGGGGGGLGQTPGSTDADLFVRQLQGRLLSALASQVTEAIFGENPQDNGTVQFGDTTVTFVRTLDSIRLTIVDATGTTEIVVPQLVVN
ncbi:curli assembly protein CsgF [Devosia albogilva]|uniref:Curli production assembly/transport component CsgF n=1 Tax=Devosia albogilva TaxID=429726 RepID=A0ABW5QM87_9HYPH